MATGNPATTAGPARRRGGWLSGILLAALIGGAAWWMWGATITGYAAAGTAFGAKSVCSCRYLGGRDMASCKQDFEPGMEAVFVSEDGDEKAITASVPLIASDTARLRDGFGCVLDTWES